MDFLSILARSVANKASFPLIFLSKSTKCSISRSSLNFSAYLGIFMKVFMGIKSVASVSKLASPPSSAYEVPVDSSVSDICKTPLDST